MIECNNCIFSFENINDKYKLYCRNQYMYEPVICTVKCQHYLELIPLNLSNILINDILKGETQIDKIILKHPTTNEIPEEWITLFNSLTNETVENFDNIKKLFYLLLLQSNKNFIWYQLTSYSTIWKNKNNLIISKINGSGHIGGYSIGEINIQGTYYNNYFTNPTYLQNLLLNYEIKDYYRSLKYRSIIKFKCKKCGEYTEIIPYFNIQCCIDCREIHQLKEWHPEVFFQDFETKIEINFKNWCNSHIFEYLDYIISIIKQEKLKKKIERENSNG
jgi:hypothetical protein